MSDTALASVVVQRRVEWPDTDAAGHYHYTTVFRLAEAGEATLQERLGIDLHDTFGRTPRVRVHAEFRSVLLFRDLVDVVFAVTAVGRSSVTYRFEILRDGEITSSGELVTVLLDRARGGPVPWPQVWRERLLTGGPQRPELLT